MLRVEGREQRKGHLVLLSRGKGKGEGGPISCHYPLGQPAVQVFLSTPSTLHPYVSLLLSLTPFLLHSFPPFLLLSFHPSMSLVSLPCCFSLSFIPYIFLSFPPSSYSMLFHNIYSILSVTKFTKVVHFHFQGTNSYLGEETSMTTVDVCVYCRVPTAGVQMGSRRGAFGGLLQ